MIKLFLPKTNIIEGFKVIKQVLKQLQISVVFRKIN